MQLLGCNKLFNAKLLSPVAILYLDSRHYSMISRFCSFSPTFCILFLKTIAFFFLVWSGILLWLNQCIFYSISSLKEWLLSSGAFCILHLKRVLIRSRKLKLVKSYIYFILCLHCLAHGVQFEGQIQNIFFAMTVNP